MRACLLLVVALVPHLAGQGDDEQPQAIAASRVTLKSASITLLDSLKELQKQTGNAVEDGRPRRGQAVTNPPLALDFENVPFWEALDAIARKAQVRVYVHTGTGSVGVLKGPPGELPLSYSGPFRVALQRLTAVLDLESGNRYLEASVELAWEPRYRPLLLKLGSESIKVSLEGEESKPASPTGRGDVRLIGQQAVEFPLRLPAPPRSAKTLKQLEGVFPVLVAPRMLTFDFDATAARQTVLTDTQAGVTAAVSQFRAERGTWTVVIDLKYPPEAFDLESHQTWAVQDALRFEKDGKPLESLKPLGRDVNVKERGAIQVTYRVGGVPRETQGVVLRHEAPAVPVLFPVRFSFQDAPLP